jgi:hypothetical protein
MHLLHPQCGADRFSWRLPATHPCSNASLVAPLLEKSRMLGAGGPRLLRLLCRCLFNGGLYTQRSRIARGAYAHVSTLLCETPALQQAKFFK